METAPQKPGGRFHFVREGGVGPTATPVAASRRLEPRAAGARPEEFVHPLTREMETAPQKPGGRFHLVREGGVEPPRPFGHWHLKPARLPIPPLARVAA